MARQVLLYDLEIDKFLKYYPFGEYCGATYKVTWGEHKGNRQDKGFWNKIEAIKFYNTIK